MRKRLERAGKDLLAQIIVKRSNASETIKEVRRERLTYLSIQKFAQIVSTIDKLKKDKVPGQFIEAGCALGGSSIVIASVMPADRILKVYDVFGQIPPPSDMDPIEVKERYATISSGNAEGIDGDQYYGYVQNLKRVVINNLSNFLPISQISNIELIEGMIQDTMQIKNDVAFAHIDVDWYEPVLISLERIDPWLSVGGCVILDDYFDWGGCKDAVDDFLSRNGRRYEAETFFGNMKLKRIS